MHKAARLVLLCALFAGTAGAESVLAPQTSSVFGGWNALDVNRHAHDDTTVSLGFRRTFGEKWGVDLEFESYNRHFEQNYLESIGLSGYEGRFRVKQYQFSARRFFRQVGIRPNVLGTVGLERTRASVGSGEDLPLSLGAGLSYAFRAWGAVRVQIVRRISYNDRVDTSVSSL